MTTAKKVREREENGEGGEGDVAICSFYVRGLCTKGKDCVFSHDALEGNIVVPSSNSTRKKKMKKMKKLEKLSQNHAQGGGEKEYSGAECGCKDIPMLCQDCKGAFIFTGKNQRYFENRRYPPPIRCRPCREKSGGKV